MSKIVLSGHPSIGFGFPEVYRGDDLLHRLISNEGIVVLSGYDFGYPVPACRGRPNLIGGNPMLSDGGPLGCFIREVGEELATSGERSKVENLGRSIALPYGARSVDDIRWASDDDITLIKDEFLNEARHDLDFLVDSSSIPLDVRSWDNSVDGPNPDKDVKSKVAFYIGGGKHIMSVFLVPLSEKVMDCIIENLRAGNRLTTEGFMGVHYVGQLEAAGKHSTAHATAPVLNHYLHARIPFPDDKIKVLSTSNPRKRYDDYRKEFDYTQKAFRP